MKTSTGARALDARVALRTPWHRLALADRPVAQLTRAARVAALAGPRWHDVVAHAGRIGPLELAHGARRGHNAPVALHRLFKPIEIDDDFLKRKTKPFISFVYLARVVGVVPLRPVAVMDALVVAA